MDSKIKQSGFWGRLLSVYNVCVRWISAFFKSFVYEVRPILNVSWEFLRKITTLKSGGLLRASMVLGLIFASLVNIYAMKTHIIEGPPTDSYIDVLLAGANKKYLLIPIFGQFIGLAFYALFNLLDLITGLQASRYENTIKEVPDDRWLKSSKLFKSLWKSLGVLLITSMISVLSVSLEVVKSNTIPYWTSIWILCAFWIMAVGFEFHSVGENIERFSGTKPPIFGFWDKILDAFEKKTIKKIDDM